MKTLISQELRQALLISFFWHLFCMSFVSVVVMPVGLQPRKHFLVSFLGSVLKGPVFREEIKAAAKTDFVKLPLEAELAISKDLFCQRPDLVFSEEKEVIDFDSLMGPDAFKKEESPFTNSVTAEPAHNEREIIFRPEFPRYPEWIQQDFWASYVIFNIYISAEGLVGESICLQASGNPEIDAILARYIEGWRFAPCANHQGHWQTVKIDLDTDG